MQPARLFTAAAGGFPITLPRQRGGPAVAALLALLLIGASALILEHPKAAVWDQARLLETRFEVPFHPSPAYGLSVQLLVVALKAVVPEAALHPTLRIVALAFWAGAATWLGLALLARRGLVVVLLLALFTSQYPFLWLSSELVIGGLLCLALGAWVRGAAPLGVGALLALLALAKPDLVVVALLLGVCFARERREEARALAIGFAATGLLLLLPGLLVLGPGYLVDYDSSGGRGFASFRQHFAALLAPLQLAPGPDPWLRPGPYVERRFPGAASMLDVVRAPGLAYLDHVALSLARGVRRALWVFQWAWLALPPLWWARRRAGLALDGRERALLWSFVGCATFVLFAYPHVRYFARYYPLFWILLLMSAEKLGSGAPPAGRRAWLAAAGACLLLALAENAERAAVGLALAPGLPQYWFPD